MESKKIQNDMTQPVPSGKYRLIFRLPSIGWVRGWFGDSWFEAQQYARGLSGYDVRILENGTGEIKYERASQSDVNYALRNRDPDGGSSVS